MIVPIVPTERFDENVRILRRDYPQIDKVVRITRWALVRDPYLGEPVPNRENRYIYLTSPFEFSTPVFRVLYKFSETNPKTIVLLAIGSPTQD